jgi:hypothetical protein
VGKTTNEYKIWREPIGKHPFPVLGRRLMGCRGKCEYVKQIELPQHQIKWMFLNLHCECTKQNILDYLCGYFLFVYSSPNIIRQFKLRRMM